MWLSRVTETNYTLKSNRLRHFVIFLRNQWRYRLRCPFTPLFKQQARRSVSGVFLSIGPGSKCIVSFYEDLNRTKRKHLNEMTAKGIRNRLPSLLTHLQAVAKQGDVSGKVYSAYSMMLCSQAECDFTSPKFCKDIITNGSFGPVCNKMNCDKAAFLRDSLEISKVY